MKIFRIVLNLFSVVGILLSSQQLYASAFEELSDNDQYKLKAGQQVALFTSMQSPYAALPQGTIFQRIDATPEEAVAVFFDFNHHSEFLPKVLKSEISTFVDKTTSQVDYVVGLLHLPFGLATENYTLEYHLDFNSKEKSYSITWHSIRSGTFTEYSQGEVRFEPMESGGSLIAYKSFVLPYSTFYYAAANPIAVAVSKSVLKSVVNRIATQITKERTMESARLDQQVKALKKVLGH